MRAGDRVLLSGTIADHGMAVLMARGELELEAEIESDTAPLHGLVALLLAACDGVRADARPNPRRSRHDAERTGTRRGAARSRLTSERYRFAPPLRGACELLGIDPLYVANEGKLVVVVAPEAADRALAALRAAPARHRGRDRR